MMMPYSEYKDSKLDWLGNIPSHWDLVKLGACFKERNEKVSDKDFAALSVTKNGILPQMEHVAKTDAGDNRKKVCIGDFVINSRSDRKGSSGTSDYDGSVSLISIILEPRLYEPRFAHHLLRSYNFQEEFYKYGKGIVADLWSTRYSDMKNIFVPLMPIAEQKAIATFLDRETLRIDSLIEEKETFIKLLKEKRQALISHVVTKGLNPNVEMQDSGIEWIGQVPKHWGISKVRYLGQCQNGINIGGEFFGHGTPFVSYGDVYNNTSLPEKVQGLVLSTEKDRDNYSVIAGDVLFTRTSETIEEIGFSAVCKSTIEQAVFAGFLIRFRPDEGNLEVGFSEYYFRNEKLRAFFAKEMNLVTRASLSQDLLKKMPVLLPPIDEQNEIANYLQAECNKFSEIFAETEKTILLLKERRTSLISAAVTGKIDVRETV
ncbi:restriction endonuclease subunit S [Escherichia coli]|uniref:restriction endonuclease subunit S n=1 Tax=Enterobacter cloacae TaxID=550 RepID=UPI001C3F030A|nr:restriction endonuclease subunit S [Enterobacter cloacae]EIS6242093.1 restriction endonuclease subunit S [Escherichia coli]